MPKNRLAKFRHLALGVVDDASSTRSGCVFSPASSWSSSNFVDAGASPFWRDLVRDVDNIEIPFSNSNPISIHQATALSQVSNSGTFVNSSPLAPLLGSPVGSESRKDLVVNVVGDSNVSVPGSSDNGICTAGACYNAISNVHVNASEFIRRPWDNTTQ